MGVASMYIASSSSIADGAVSEAKLAAEACSAAKMKKEGVANQVLTSNGAGAVPSYKAPAIGNEGGGSLNMVPPIFPAAVQQGTWAYTFEAGCTPRCYIDNTSSGAQNDAITFDAGYLTAGTYSLFMMASRDTDFGIIKIKDAIAGNTLATFDTFHNPADQNNISATTGINIAVAGIKTIQLIMDTKNAGSSAYKCKLQALCLRRTA